MILILLLCIKLSILHLCVSEHGYECRLDNSRNDPVILLIDQYKPNASRKMNGYLQNELNSKFIKFCGYYYNIKTGSLEDAKNYTNVIQFAGPNYNDGMALGKFKHNISKIYEAVCTIRDEDLFDCHEIVNRATPSVKYINDGHIYEILQEMQLFRNNDGLIIKHRESCEPHFQKTSNLTIVLLCYRRGVHDDDHIEKQVNIKPLTLIQLHDDYCFDYLNKTLKSPPSHLNHLLAVLAPKPFELPSGYLVPTIFYEAPYLYSEDKADCPNSMNLVPWRLLKYGFLKFIQKVGWERVAIVTDDSEYSLDFEDELTALLSKERLVYTVIRCEDTKCDMDKITQQLHRVSARIVIANVDEKHAIDLLQHPGVITWLLRDMAGKIPKVGWPPRAFSFSLHSTNDTGCTDVEDNILTGLSSIAQAYKTLRDKDYIVKKPEFYRLFAERVKQMTPRITAALIFVVKLDGQQVASMYVNENGANILDYKDPYEAGKPTDGTSQCLVSTYNYHEPCEDPLVMLLMFVFMMFVLTILLITCFFDKTSPFNDIRYQHF